MKAKLDAYLAAHPYYAMIGAGIVAYLTQGNGAAHIKALFHSACGG